MPYFSPKGNGGLCKIGQKIYNTYIKYEKAGGDMAAVSRTYDTPHGRIVYWVDPAGADRPWLVFLPGLTADHRLFARQMEAFSGRYNCLTWDAPAHGRSRPFALAFDMDDMAHWLHGILQQEGADRPVLVGQSLGGYISQVYMALYPGAVRGFVSIDSCSLRRVYYTGWELAMLKHTERMYLSIPWNLLKAWGIAGTAKSTYGRAVMADMLADYEKREYCALADHGFRIFAQAVEAERDYTLRCPTLLICGTRDQAGSAKRYNKRWTEQEGHRMVWLPGAGHNANTDLPETVNLHIGRFVEELQ